MDTSELAATLRHAQNADGGWAYYAGRVSRLEPTCWAVLALGPRDIDESLARLRGWPARGGLLLERPAGSVNFAFHAFALMTLTNQGLEHDIGHHGLMAALAGTGGITLPASSISRQDNSLQGWPWVTDTFSWAEPTAWCLLALKQWRKRGSGPRFADRIEEAERLLIDRTCIDGGWNYGNSNVLGANLHPYVPTTALGLLAMQDQRDEPAVARSLSWLERNASSEPSGMALALACVALAVYGCDVSIARVALASRSEVTADIGNIASIAATLYALENRDDYAAFTL